MDKFISECKELKKQVEIFTRQLEKANKEVIKEKEKNATQRQKNEKYEQTLTEIKEITKSFCNACKEFEPEKSEDKTTCLYCNYGKILKVINDQKERLPNKHKQALKEIEKLSENAYCLTNGTNKDMAEFAKTIIIKVNEVLNDT